MSANSVSMKKSMQKSKTVLFSVTAVSVVAVLMLSAAIFSSVKFGTINFFSSFPAMFSVLSGNDEVIVISDSPKILIGSPESSADKFSMYMSGIGYTLNEEEQLGGVLVFDKNGERQKVAHSVNGYYSLWKFID